MNKDEKLKRREKKLFLLHEVTRELASASKLENVLTKMTETAAFIADAEEAALFLLDEKSKKLYLRAIKNFDKETARIRFDDVTDKLKTTVLSRRKAITLNEEEYKHATGIVPKSFLCIPVSSKEEEMGSLCVYNIQTEKELLKKDEEFLVILAGYAATFIKNTILLGVANVKASTLSDLYEVSKLMLSEINLEKLLEIIVDNALRVLDADIVILYEYLKDIDDLKMPPIVAGRNIRFRKTLMKRGIKHRESVLFKLIKRKEPFYAPNARGDWSIFLQTEMDNKTAGIGDFIHREGIVSSSAVPLRIYDEPVGLLFINFRSYHHFTTDRKIIIEAFANEAALAIRNARIFTQRDRYIVELSVLNKIGQEISSSVTLSTDAILDLIYQQTGRLMDVSYFYVAFYHPEDATVSFEFGVEEGKKEEMGVGQWASRKAGRGLTEYVIRTKKALLIPNKIMEWYTKHIDKVELIGTLTNCWLGAPMIYENKVLGVIVIQNAERENAYDEGNMKLLETIASQAAIAITKARLFQESKKQLVELNGLYNELNSLYNISQEIVSKSPDIMSVLKTILDKAVQISNADAGELLFYNESTRRITVALTHNLDAIKGITQEPGKGMAGKVITEGKAIYTNDFFNSQYVAPELDKPEFRKLFKGVVQVPLKWQDEFLGVLALSSRPGSERIFTDKDVERLNHFAGSASIAIAIARNISFRQIMLDDNPDAIIAVDRNGFITQFNKSSEHIMGFKKNEVVGKYVAEFYYEGEKEAIRINHILIENEKMGEPVKNIRTAVRGSNGEYIPILFSGVILRNELGEKIGTIGLMTDLREIEQLDEEFRKQQQFLTEIEQYPQDTPINTLSDLQKRMKKILDMTRNFLQLEYIILFASAKEDDTVLKAIAWTELPPDVHKKLPHFNWRKAGFLTDEDGKESTTGKETELINKWLPDEEWKQSITSGIRGNNANFFSTLSCGVPVRLADNYRAVLIFGPFREKPDLLKIEGFIRHVAQTININALSWLQALYLRARSKEVERSKQLIVHRTRMQLQLIIGKFGLIKGKSKKETSIKKEAEKGEALVEHLSSILTRALISPIAEMEPADFHFQSYPLPALIQNCVEGFRERAHFWRRELIVEQNVEFLPYAEIDPLMLSVALGNLIENALKYSMAKTAVRISSKYDDEEAIITVQDYGHEMSENARINLFEPGMRWGARSIPGTGFGLWDSSVIVNAHGGKLDFTSGYTTHKEKPTNIVKVWMIIPLKHPKT